ncbi:MAG TPA: methyltransferase domain-containing protein [Stellaceae bacterium]|nr:methyltransferase domain-containing protein [Stellaceae bacterium]
MTGNEQWDGLVTLDHNDDHKPDHIWDLEKIPLPFEENHFDEIHAYEVLEHTGAQGDWRFFFAQWSDFWRILKPDGLFHATVPMWNSIWAWGDPSHRRVINSGTLVFLSQAQYQRQVGKTPMSDFRFCYQADFEPVYHKETEHQYLFILRAKKPPLGAA